MQKYVIHSLLRFQRGFGRAKILSGIFMSLACQRLLKLKVNDYQWKLLMRIYTRPYYHH